MFPLISDCTNAKTPFPSRSMRTKRCEYDLWRLNMTNIPNNFTRPSEASRKPSVWTPSSIATSANDCCHVQRDNFVSRLQCQLDKDRNVTRTHLDGFEVRCHFDARLENQEEYFENLSLFQATDTFITCIPGAAATFAISIVGVGVKLAAVGNFGT